MSVVITGATGHLGRLVVADLLAKSHPADQVVAVGRDTEKLAELAGTGVRTARIDLEDPESLKAAFQGADTLLLVSGSEVGKRVPQHTNAVEAAKAVGIGHVVYTSAPRATDTTLVVAPEHKVTEEVIAASGIAYTILRNGWYNENYARHLDQARESGVIIGSAGEGKVASASRQDFAEAASVVVRDPKAHAGAVYELSGDTAWTYVELAEAFSEALGREVVYRNLTTEEHVAALTGAGLDESIAYIFATLDANTRDGELSDTSKDLFRLIGRPTTPLVETLRTLV